MKKTIIYLIVNVLIFNTTIEAQSTKELYMPFELKQAYLKQTRNMDGKPGKNYFQNQTDYVIKAEFFPETKLLTGSETITYKNNSIDTLANLYLNLFQNLYKKGITRDIDIDPLNIHDGVEITNININDMPVDIGKISYFSTIARVVLPEKIAPLSEVKIKIDWKQKMPVTDVKRQGTYNKTNFFIAYWYPKICVFDDIEGWNVNGHKGVAEFYSDYGNFDIEITVPADYIVWSTGHLQNENEVFSARIIEQLNMALKSDTVIPIITEKQKKEYYATKTSKKNIWKFKSENQADFAFALSNKYLWDASSINIGNKRVLVNSVYDSNAHYFNTVAGISRNSIDFYTKKTPAIDFPYMQFTAFHGRRGGMEFPGMINDDDFDNAMETVLVTTHEVGHMFLPFYVGINEQKYGWMDEGLVTLLGIFAMSDQIGDKEHKILAMLGSKYSQAANMQTIDMPIMIPSYELSDQAAGFNTYVKPVTAFYLLNDYLGQDKFNLAIREFCNRWKGKHPTPYDMFFTFNEVVGEDLGWFWKPWFFEYGYADLGIGKIKFETNETIVNIDNIGNYPLPVILILKYKDGTEKTIKKSMNIWKSEKSISISIPKGELKEVQLNNKVIPETNYSNNKMVY